MIRWCLCPYVFHRFLVDGIGVCNTGCVCGVQDTMPYNRIGNGTSYVLSRNGSKFVAIEHTRLDRPLMDS